jgi:hypothetical protein
MKAVVLTGTGLVFLVAAGLAQAATAPGQTNQNGMSVAPSSQTSNNAQNMQEQFKRDLESAGFTDVTIMPQSFLVRAKDRQGRPVMMVINPDSVTALVGPTGQSATANGSNAPANNNAVGPNT